MFALRQNALSNIGYSAFTYIKYGLIDYPLTSLGGAFSDFANLWHAYSDNEYLQEQLAQQRTYQTLYEEERNKNKELELLIDMQGTLGDAKTISCRVIDRSTSAWDQTVTISAGKLQGVKENMIVSTSEGAVGLVETVQTSTSIVRLCES
ncbi:MAG: rod shape-determining protein MreC [Holdemanella sp.]|nr:rod shape-determining protein MreC [Holdemanella sp.]